MPPAASRLAAGSAQVLVDWGGATGALAAAACSMYPGLSAVVLDLPHVVDKAQQHFSQRPAALVGATAAAATWSVWLRSACSAAHPVAEGHGSLQQHTQG
jgi:hypothetical protein